MTYQTTITQKGQLTLPKEVRELLGLHTGERVVLEPDSARKSIKIEPAASIAHLAGSFHPKHPRDPVSIRAKMEKSYART